MTRREARAEIISLIFEYAFRPGESAESILNGAVECRGLEDEEYIRSCFAGTVEKLGFIDGKIEQYSNGWKIGRISPVALAVMRLAIYEMYFRDDVPAKVALNEALELVKTYDDADKVKPFVNGILNAVMQEPDVK